MHFFKRTLSPTGRREFSKYEARVKQLCSLSRQVFELTNGTVFIPHPDTNPAERAMYKGGDDDNAGEMADDGWDVEDMDNSAGDGDNSSSSSAGDDDDDAGSGSD